MRLKNLPRIFITLAFVAVACAATSAQVIVIKAGRLLDPETGTAAVNQTIVVEGLKIKSIGANAQVPAGAQVYDLSAYTVLPGLFDAHTHLCQSTQPEQRSNFSIDISETGEPATLSIVNARQVPAATPGRSS